MDCGPACVRMVASYYGKDYPLSYLRSLAHLTREGVSVAGIRDSLTAIGMNSATFDEHANQHWYIGRLLTQIAQITHDNL